MRPRTAADRDGLADVQRPAGLVAEQVHARVARELREVELRKRTGRRAARRRCRGRRGRRGRSSATASATVAALAHSRGNSAHRTLRARLRVGQRAVRELHVDAERVRQRRQAALTLERQQHARERRGAQHRRLRPLGADPLERLPEHAPVERSVVGDQHPARQPLGERADDLLELRRAVEHLLRDPGEPPDAPAERHARAHQRAPPVVQLAAADQHRSRPRSSRSDRRPDPLVSVSTTRNSAVAIGCSSSSKHRVIRPAPDGMQAALRTPCLGDRSGG